MKKMFSRLISSVLITSVIVGALASCTKDGGNSTDNTDTKEADYNAALVMIEEGKYENAYAALLALGDYKDAKKRLDRFIYYPTEISYDLFDRAGVMNVTLGELNLPTRIVSVGDVGTKDGVYTYDSEGRILRQSVTHNGKTMRYDYTYDENDRIIKAEYSEDGVVSIVHDFTIDEKGRLVRELYTVENVVQYDGNNFYDENGNVIKRVAMQYGVDCIYTYTHDADGRITNEKCEASDGNDYNIDFFYDEAGMLVKEIYTDAENEVTTFYTYDDSGNRVKDESIYADGTRNVIARAYDAHGNVTREVYTYSDGVIETIERKFTLAYISIDVPEDTMSQIDLFLTIK